MRISKKIKSYCKACNKEIWSFPSRIHIFCSVSCKTTGKYNPNAKPENHFFFNVTKGRFLNNEIKRKKIRDKEGKWVFEHRLIAETTLGRKLKANEVVHHINCNSLDNRKENLLICNKQYHTWLHQYMSELWAKEKFVSSKTITPEEITDAIEVSTEQVKEASPAYAG